MTKDLITIALDAMGGDHAPRSILEGANLALKAKKYNLFFKIFGNQRYINPILEKFPLLKKNSEVIHTDKNIKNDDKPADALRNGRESSMRLSINAVKDGIADAVISAGNTGALMAISKYVLQTLPDIYRPAIVTCIPTRKRPCTLLDLGANAMCSKDQMLQFAIMGDAFAKVILNKEHPTIGLLNIGTEALKGNELVQETSELLKQHPSLNYVGFAEGNDYFSGNFDVIVSDGFSGNIALKVLEGTSKFVKDTIVSFLKSSIFTKLFCALFILLFFRGLLKTKKAVDPRTYNGALLVGLNGISVKSHGSADKYSIFSAIHVTCKLVTGNINQKIIEEIHKIHAENKELSENKVE